jgi:hypothetical protein
MAAAKKKRPSGPSGRNTKPGVLLRAPDYEIAAWRAAAASPPEATTLTRWARDVLNAAAFSAGFQPGMRAHVRRQWPGQKKRK